MIEPLRLSFEVQCALQRAFALWTRHASVWWPKDHTISGQADLEIIFEPHVGGRIFERTPGGDEHDWGEITAWEPPHRVAYVWHLATERKNATSVEVRFVERGPAGTRVEIEHGGWDRLGPDFGQERRNANQRGWTGLLPHFQAACLQAAATSGH
jgi:uncharacterized protein YndB with AHSA1/START domain